MFWKRLLISYLLVIMIALSFLGYVVFNQINTNFVNQVIYSNQIILENGSNTLSDFILRMKNLTLDISVNTKLQDNLSRFNNGLPILTHRFMNEIIYENQYINDELSKNYARLKIYPIKNDIIFNYSDMYGSYLAIKKNGGNSYIFDTFEKNGGFVTTSLYENDSNYLAITSLVFDINNWSEPIAIVELNISAIAVSSLLYNIKLEKNISPYIIDGDGQVFLPYLDYIQLDNFILLDSSEQPVEVDGKIYLKKNVASTKWKMVGILPKNTIDEKSKGIIKSFIYTGLLTILVLIVLSVYLANWLSNPLKRLARRLKSFEPMEFEELTVRRWYSTEVKTLYEQYNYMIARIKNLIQEVYDSAEKEKNAELLALQAQINPHFLYNTLDSINWMAMKY
ncbi:MAG: histidine kinase, partial [Clostridiales bacterium]|nr:histidine kinase [Clostridiales bacterium]